MRVHQLLAFLALPLLVAAGGHKHGEDMGLLNAALGVHGYPDCVQPLPPGDDIEANQLSLVCSQRGAATAQKIACVGDR